MALEQRNFDDSVILKIKNMSDGQLTINLDKVREDNLFEKLYRERNVKQFSSNSGGGREGRRRVATETVIKI